MKSLFMVFILFLHSNGTLEVVRTVDKSYSESAGASLRWLSDPKHWNHTLTPIDGFIFERRVTEREWEEHVYNPRYRGSEVIFYGEGKEESMLLLPRRESP